MQTVHKARGMWCSLVVRIVLWWVGICSFVNAEKCNQTSDFQFTITSRRNNTGHWIAQVQLEHSTSSDKKDVKPWDVDIVQTTTKCKDAERIKIVTTVTVPTNNQVLSSKQPNAGYELVPGFGYYKMHVTNKTWNDAYHFCTLEGAHLLVLNSEEEANALKRLWVKHPGKPGGWNWAYVGFHCLYNEGEFVTLFNQQLSEAGYNKWYPGHPGASPSRFCGIVHDSMLLGDTICNDHLAFICEQNI